MHTTDLSEKNFAAAVQKPGILLVDFWASWCAPCRAFAPVYDKVAAKNPDVVFGKIDTEAQPGLAAQFGISAIPTLMIFRDGIPIYGQPGAMPGGVLEDLLQQTRKLDMDEVRAEVAAEAGKKAKHSATG